MDLVELVWEAEKDGENVAQEDDEDEFGGYLMRIFGDDCKENKEALIFCKKTVVSSKVITKLTWMLIFLGLVDTTKKVCKNNFLAAAKPASVDLAGL